MIRRRVYVVALDGGTWSLLGPWMDQGLLPNLKALVEGGASGDLESTVPPMTAPAWTSFMTGLNPGKHAIYDFLAEADGGYRVRPVNARARRGTCLWEVISQEGGRVAVLNVPTTYPPDPVRGAMVADFLTPSGKRDFAHPPGLLEEIEGKFGRYRLYPVRPVFVASEADSDIERFVNEYVETTRYRFRVGRYLIDKLDPHFFMLHLYGNDQISHWLWHLLDPTHPQHDPGLSERHLAKILEYYRVFDAELGALAARRKPDTALVVMSDHGFGPLHQVINLNAWLMQEGYLVLKGGPATRLRHLLWRLGLTPETLARRRWVRRTLGRLLLRALNDPNVEKMARLHSRTEWLLSLNDADWSRTRAFCHFGWGQIKINTRGRYPQGCVAPGAEYLSLRAEIVDKLRALRDPRTGERIDGEVFTRDDVYWGPSVEAMPDITFLPMAKHYWANSRGTGFVSNQVFSPYLWGMTGMHTSQGILVAQGPPLRQGVRVEGAQIVDLFPTILYLMGLGIPEGLDGKILLDIFRDEFLAEHPVEGMTPADQAAAAPLAITQDEEEDVIQRLRGLGYL